MSGRASFHRPSQFSSHTGTQCSATSPGPIGIPLFEIDVELRADEFPHIAKRNAELHRLAIRSGKELSRVRDFKKTYAKVQKVLSDVSLKLDETGKLTMAFTKPKTASELVSDAVVAKLADEMKSKMNKGSDLFTSERGKAQFNKFNVVLSQLVILLEIRKGIDSRELVAQQWSKRRNEAMSKKVKFCLAAIAANRLGTSKTTQYTDLYISLWKKYEDFESKLNAWLRYVELEDRLAGTYRVVPEKKMWPARSQF